MNGLIAQIAVRRPDGFEVEVDLEIAHGSTVAVLGPNGAGKSTLVGVLAGVLPIDSGRIVLGTDVLDDPSEKVFVDPENRDIGIVFQDYLLFPHLTVADNVGFGLLASGLPKSEVTAMVDVWLERSGLTGISGKKARELSGGQAQQVAVARAIMSGPRMLVFDEPMAALDATSRVEMRRRLADHLNEFDGPRLLITHDATEAFLLAENIYVMENGRVTQSGTADDIRLRPQTAYVADLAGSNLLKGSAASGGVDLGNHRLHTAETSVEGQVLVTIHPRAISLHSERPHGSPRNVWETTIERVEHYGDRVRIQTGGPVRLAVEVTPSAVQALAMAPGVHVWVSIKATEIGVQPA